MRNLIILLLAAAGGACFSILMGAVYELILVPNFDPFPIKNLVQNVFATLPHGTVLGVVSGLSVAQFRNPNRVGKTCLFLFCGLTFCILSMATIQTAAIKTGVIFFTLPYLIWIFLLTLINGTSIILIGNLKNEKMVVNIGRDSRSDKE